MKHLLIAVAVLALCGCETITGTVTVPGVGSFTPAIRPVLVANPVVVQAVQPVVVQQPVAPVYPAPPPYMPAEMPMRATMTVEK